jgi:hypothetical protein
MDTAAATVRRTIIAAQAGVKLLEVRRAGISGLIYVVESRATSKTFTTDSLLEARRAFAAWVANGGEPAASHRDD